MAKGLGFLYSSEDAKEVKAVKKFDVVGTPSVQMNWALCGGLPMGYIIRFMGQPSAGKTLQAILAAVEFQKKYSDGVVIFKDFEQSFMAEWASGLGLDLGKDRFVLHRDEHNSGASFFDWLIDDVFPGLIEKGLRAFIIVDSVDAMVAPKEEGRSAGEFEVAAMAAFLPKVLRKCLGKLNESGSTMLFINQVRANPGQLYGNPEGTAGGNALKHASVLDVHFAAVLKKEEHIFDDAKQRIGHKVRFKIPKNKIAQPYRGGEYRIVYTRGVVDKNIELAELAKKLNVVERPNNRRYVLGDTTYDGFDNFAKALTDEELFESVFKKCMEYEKNQAK